MFFLHADIADSILQFINKDANIAAKAICSICAGTLYLGHVQMPTGSTAL